MPRSSGRSSPLGSGPGVECEHGGRPLPVIWPAGGRMTRMAGRVTAVPRATERFETRAHPVVRGVSHRMVEVDGVRLHVAEAGSGPTLLLLHGWPQHWWCWRKLIPDLARTHRVIAPDLRGWGWS